MWITKKHLQATSGLQLYRSKTVTKNEFLSDIAMHTLTTVTARRRVSKQCGCKRAWDNVQVNEMLENGNALGHHILIAPQEAAMTVWRAGGKTGPTCPTRRASASLAGQSRRLAPSKQAPLFTPGTSAMGAATCSTWPATMWPT